MSKEKPGLWPGQICPTRTGASPGSSLICLTKYELSKIPDLKDLNFFQPYFQPSFLFFIVVRPILLPNLSLH